MDCGSVSGGWAIGGRAKGRREAPESREVEATLHSILGLRWGGISRNAPLLCWRLDRVDPGINRTLAHYEMWTSGCAKTHHGPAQAPNYSTGLLDSTWKALWRALTRIARLDSMRIQYITLRRRAELPNRTRALPTSPRQNKHKRKPDGGDEEKVGSVLF